MKISVFSILLMFSGAVMAQGTSNHYKSLNAGSVTSGAVQSSSHSKGAIVNIWTQAHAQSSTHYRNRTAVVVQHPDSSTDIKTIPAIVYFDIYPNPSSEFIRIVSDIEISNIWLLDLSGKRVLYSSAKHIDISSLQPGVYLVVAYSEDKVGIKRVVRQ